MRRFILSLAFLVALSPATRAWDACEGRPDCLGVYFDAPTYDENCLSSVPVFTLLDLYFVVKSPSPATITGFQFAWFIDPAPQAAPLVLALSLPTGAPAAIDPDNLLVTLDAPLAVSDPLLLARVTLMFLADPAYGSAIGVGPATPPALPGYAVLLADGPVPLHVGPDGSGQGAVACLACECYDPVEQASWGAVKALYR